MKIMLGDASSFLTCAPMRTLTRCRRAL